MEEYENNNQSNKPDKFGVPEGYFNKSAASIVNKIEWEEEHKTYPLLLKYRKSNGFSLPENYFSSSGSRLELLDYEKLLSIPRENRFSVPEGYFELSELELLGTIGKVNVDEIVHSKLSGIKQQNNFSTDETYFTANEEKLKTLLKKQQSTRVIDLFRKNFAYAAAAVVVITFGIWSYNVFLKEQQEFDCGTIACADRLDLVNGLNFESLDNDELYEMVDVKELEKKLKEEVAIAIPENDSNNNNVSDEDLLDEL